MRQFNLEKMRKACSLAAETLRVAGASIRPGITTDEINKIVHNHTIQNNGYPAPLNYRGFPRSCCTSVNDVVCHGIPGSYVLKDSDIINVDVTTILDGHFGDTSATFTVGRVKPEVQALVDAARQALDTSIEVLHPGVMLNDITKRLQFFVEDHGYTVVRGFGGHGIGTQFHTSPHINHFDTLDNAWRLKPGMIFTIEPMVNMGAANVHTEADNWTIKTDDGSLSAQFEHTVMITDDGYELLTK